MFDLVTDPWINQPGNPVSVGDFVAGYRGMLDRLAQGVGQADSFSLSDDPTLEEVQALVDRFGASREFALNGTAVQGLLNVDADGIPRNEAYLDWAERCGMVGHVDLRDLYGRVDIPSRPVNVQISGAVYNWVNDQVDIVCDMIRRGLRIGKVYVTVSSRVPNTPNEKRTSMIAGLDLLLREQDTGQANGEHLLTYLLLGKLILAGVPMDDIIVVHIDDPKANGKALMSRLAAQHPEIADLQVFVPGAPNGLGAALERMNELASAFPVLRDGRRLLYAQYSKHVIRDTDDIKAMDQDSKALLGSVARLLLAVLKLNATFAS
jgi:hypothetical protein